MQIKMAYHARWHGHYITYYLYEITRLLIIYIKQFKLWFVCKFDYSFCVIYCTVYVSMSRTVQKCTQQEIYFPNAMFMAKVTFNGILWPGHCMEPNDRLIYQWMSAMWIIHEAVCVWSASCTGTHESIRDTTSARGYFVARSLLMFLLRLETGTTLWCMR